MSESSAIREVGSLRIGGIGREVPHPAEPEAPLRGGPQVVEVSRDGERVHVTSSLYDAWDGQSYPGGVGAWMAEVDVDTVDGGVLRPAVRPRGGRRSVGGASTRCDCRADASSDSYCFP